jgi:superfamily II DNA or RNA helicase
VCPAGLQLQWRDEMRDKFGLEFRIIDSEALRELRRRRGLGVNPWTYFPRIITSIDFLKRDRSMRSMREVLPGPGEPIYPRRFDLLIVDEAHNVAPAGRGGYSIDSLRTDCIRELAQHFEHKLFLTATPHNGYTESFAALLELLDDQRFHRSVPPDRAQLERVMVRRLKKELPKDNLGRARFPERILDALEVDFPDDERHAHGLLREYADLRAQAGEDDDEGGGAFATQFVMRLLKKRLFSSPEAFRLTLEAHLESVKRRASDSSRPERVRSGILRREIARLEEDFAEDDLYEEETRAAVMSTSRVLRPLSTREREITKELVAWSEKAAARLDAKATAFFEWLEALVRPKAKWTDTRVIVFTEYRATQKWLAEKLAMRGFTQDGRLLTLYGGMSPEDREKIKHAFQAPPDKSKVRILLATDAASEGIDLQNYCSRLIHYEVPWNPNRMEQRNGRVDRHGQKAEKVEIFHFVGKGWHEKRMMKDAEPGSLEGDLEFLFLAARKVDQIREDLGNAGDVLATQVEEAMLGKRRKLDTDITAPRASAARKMLRFERDLAARLAKLTQQLGKNREELHIEPDAIRAVVEVGLALAGHPPLAPVRLAGPNGGVEAWMVPALAGTWASCLDGLADPHTGEMRPILFDEAVARDREGVVFAHLGSRLVQMCVGLLRAEVWAPEEQRKLSRVSARIGSKLDRPLLTAYARLVVLGSDSTRLHEEVLFAGGALDKGRFVPLPAEDLARPVEGASREVPRGPSAATQKDVLKLWPAHRDRLEETLLARAKERETPHRRSGAPGSVVRDVCDRKPRRSRRRGAAAPARHRRIARSGSRAAARRRYVEARTDRSHAPPPPGSASERWSRSPWARHERSRLGAPPCGTE